MIPDGSLKLECKNIRLSGMSIVEVLIGFAIFGIVLTGFMVMRKNDSARMIYNKNRLDHRSIEHYFLNRLDCDKTAKDPNYGPRCSTQAAINIRDQGDNIILPSTGLKMGNSQVRATCNNGEIKFYAKLQGEREIQLFGSVPLLCPEPEICPHGVGIVPPFYLVPYMFTGNNSGVAIAGYPGRPGCGSHCTPCRIDSLCVQGPRGFATSEYRPKFGSSCSLTSYVPRNGYGCFAEDTLITMLDGSKRPIFAIKAGDFVWNPALNQPAKVRKVVMGPEKNPMFELYFDKYKVTVTEDHPFLTSRGWVGAKDLRPFDSIFGKEEELTLLSVHKISATNPPNVWNLEIDSENPNNAMLLANDIPTGDLSMQIYLKQKIKKESVHD